MSTEQDYLLIEISTERLDAAAAPALRKSFETGEHVGLSRVILDLGQVEFIDSTGLGVLVSLLKQMAPGGRIAVVGAGPGPTRLFQITRLDTLFTLCADIEEAKQALGV